jgi:hypothetical protein
VLGFPLKTEAKLVRYPNFYVENEGKNFWKQLKELPVLQHLDQVFEQNYVNQELVFPLDSSGFANIDFSKLPEYTVVCLVAGVATWNPGVSRVALEVGLVVAGTETSHRPFVAVPMGSTA